MARFGTVSWQPNLFFLQLVATSSVDPHVMPFVQILDGSKTREVQCIEDYLHILEGQRF